MLHEETYLTLLETICKIMSLDISDECKLNAIARCVKITVEALEDIKKLKELEGWEVIYA